MLDRARALFQTVELPTGTSRLLRQAFAVHSIRGRTTETVLARVLGRALTEGYQAAVLELEQLGILP